MVLAGEQTILGKLGHKSAVPHQILVVARVHRVLVRVLAELESEESVAAPGHVLLHLDLRLLLGQPREPLPPDAAEVDLRSGSQMDVPKLPIRWRLGTANQIVSTGSEEVSTCNASTKEKVNYLFFVQNISLILPECPSAREVIANRNFKLG